MLSLLLLHGNQIFNTSLNINPLYPKSYHISMQNPQNKLVIQTQTGLVFINLHEVVFCKGEGNYTELHMQTGNTFLISYLLCEFERKMAESTFLFFRIHKSFLINIDYVIEYRNCREKKVILVGPVEIPIAHRKTKEFSNFMKNHFLNLS
jgi:two-component system, LytTR family, response regulator